MKGKFFVIILCMIFLVGTISAFEFDNRKVYDEETRTATIENAFGLGNKLADITLTTPLDNKVIAGEDRLVAEFTIDNVRDYSNVFNNMEFYDLHDFNKKIDREFTYKYKVYVTKTRDVYDLECNNPRDELDCKKTNEMTIQYDDVVWVEIDKRIPLKSGEIEIGIFTDVNFGDKIEWIPTLYGERIPEWATWTEALGEENIAYYSFNESSGSNLPDLNTFAFNLTNDANMGDGNWVAGILGNALDYDGTNEHTEGATNLALNASNTVSFWLSPDADQNGVRVVSKFTSAGNPMQDWVILTGPILRWRPCMSNNTCANIDSPVLLTNGTYTHVVGVSNGTDYLYYVNGNLQEVEPYDGTIFNNDAVLSLGARFLSAEDDWYNGQIDELGFWNRSLSAAEVSQLYNDGAAVYYQKTFTDLATSVSLIAPANNTQLLLNSTQQFRANSTLENGNLTNTTLNVWFSNGTFFRSNSSNITGTLNNDTNLTIGGLASGNTYLWNFLSCADNSTGFVLCNSSLQNNSITRGTFTESAVVFNADTFETESERYYMNISTNGSSVTAATFTYNGTQQTATVTNIISNIYNLSATRIIPLINANQTLFFNFTMGGTEYGATPTTQQINETVFALCNGTYVNQFVNFTFVDEDDSSVINASIPTSTFTYWLGDGTVNKSLTFSNTTENYDYTFCASPNRTMNIDYTIQYESTGYPQRVFTELTTFTNSVTSKILYLLSTADGIFVTFQVINVAEQSLTDVTVNASREISSTETLVGSGTTDAAGAITFWLNPNFQHTFYFVKSGFNTLTTSLFPTQSSYTITLGGGTSTNVSDYTQGINYSIQPPTSTILNNDTEYNFNFSLTSNFWTVENYGFTLTNSSGTTFNTTSDTTNGGTLNVVLFIDNSTSDLIMDYFWEINDTFVNGSDSWLVFNNAGTGFGLATFFSHLSLYTSSGLFGLDSFGLGIIGFLIIFMTSGVLSFKYGINSPAAISGVVFAMTYFLDVGLDLFNGLGLSNTVPYFPTVFVGIIFIAMIIREGIK